MSASTQAAQRQIGLGRFPTAFAALALVVLIAAVIAIVALNGTKPAAPTTSGAKGEPPPAVIDHGWSSAADYWQGYGTGPFDDHGWSTAGTSTAPLPYAGPLYYNGTTPYAPFEANGATTVDSQYVAPRPRNQ